MSKSLLICLLLGFVTIAVQGWTFKSSAELSKSQILDCERRLKDLGYWIEIVDGESDDSTLAAIKAFRRMKGYKNIGWPNAADISALSRAKPIMVKADEGPHFGIDITRQIIFFADSNGRVSRILPVSTGSGELFTEGGKTRRAVTPTGRFTVYRKIDGWRDSPLGQMYYPNYLVRGVAVHGSSYVAEYPRTHGCIAVPMFAAEKLSQLMPIGTIVIVRRSFESF